MFKVENNLSTYLEIISVILSLWNLKGIRALVKRK